MAHLLWHIIKCNNEQVVMLIFAPGNKLGEARALAAPMWQDPMHTCHLVGKVLLVLGAGAGVLLTSKHQRC
jgi:hypothetical protein